MMQLRTVYTLGLLAMLLLLALPIKAQTSLTASLNPEVVGKDEITELTLVLSNANAVEYIKPPSLSNFVIMSGPVQQSGIENINGQVRRYVGISYQLKPKTTGKLVLNAAEAKADGKKFTSAPITLTVTHTSSGNGSAKLSPFSYYPEATPPEQLMSDFILKDGESVQDKIAKNMFLKVDISKTSCYVGEPLLVTYKLYTRLRSESNIAKSPSFNGFSVTDLIQGMNGQYTSETLNGRQYNVYVLRQSQLYPLQAGTVQLESISVENLIHFVKSTYAKQLDDAYDLFGNLRTDALPSDAMVHQKITLESKPVAINVKPLPDQGKPANFNGVTGKLSIHALLETNQLSTDDAGKLRVVLQGVANFPLLTAPEFNWPEGLTGYEPTSKQSINLYTAPVSGTKVFDYSFTADSAGRYTIPSISYSYFDAGEGKYQTLVTDSFKISVVKGTGNATKLLPDTAASTRSIVSTTIFSNRWMIIVPLALLVFAGLFFWLRADHRNEQMMAAVRSRNQAAEEEEQIAAAIEENRFAASEAALYGDNPQQFYALLNKALYDLLGEKLHIAPEALTKRSIEAGLLQLQMQKNDVLNVLQLLDDVTLQLYTPLNDTANMQQLYDKAVNTANQIKAIS